MTDKGWWPWHPSPRSGTHTPPSCVSLGDPVQKRPVYGAPGDAEMVVCRTKLVAPLGQGTWGAGRLQSRQRAL